VAEVLEARKQVQAGKHSHGSAADGASAVVQHLNLPAADGEPAPNPSSYLSPIEEGQLQEDQVDEEDPLEGQDAKMHHRNGDRQDASSAVREQHDAEGHFAH
jgi:hypothetical protein